MENYNDILVHLLNHSENEVVEFKAAKNNYDVDDLGKYFSALSNEANLREHDFANTYSNRYKFQGRRTSIE